MTDLDDDHDPRWTELLATSRALDDVDPAIRADLRMSLRRAVAGGGAGLGDGGGTGAGERSAAEDVRKSSRRADGPPAERSWTRAISALLVGVAAGAFGHDWLTHGEAAAPAPTAVFPDPDGGVAGPPSATREFDASLELAAPPKLGVSRSAPSVSAASTSAVSGATRLAEERALLDRARSALVRRDFAGAIAALELHRRRFAAGALEQERAALSIQLSLAQGDTEAARRQLDSLRASEPDSVFVEALEKEIDRTRDGFRSPDGISADR